jgi:MtN3 and saliva related transmembrane protein
MDSVTILGLIAGAVTSVGFIPQLIRGYKTKELDDVSYYMPLTLAFGMTLWSLYGVFVNSFPIIVANAFGIGSCITLILMKKMYHT